MIKQKVNFHKSTYSPKTLISKWVQCILEDKPSTQWGAGRAPEQCCFYSLTFTGELTLAPSPMPVADSTQGPRPAFLSSPGPSPVCFPASVPRCSLPGPTWESGYRDDIFSVFRNSPYRMGLKRVLHRTAKLANNNGSTDEQENGRTDGVFSISHIFSSGTPWDITTAS